VKNQIKYESHLAQKEDWYKGRASAFEMILDLISPSPENGKAAHRGSKRP
jgi:hypothetical protein